MVQELRLRRMDRPTVFRDAHFVFVLNQGLCLNVFGANTNAACLHSILSGFPYKLLAIASVHLKCLVFNFKATWRSMSLRLRHVWWY